MPQFNPTIGIKLVLRLWLGVVLHILIGLGVLKPHFAHPWAVLQNQKLIVYINTYVEQAGAELDQAQPQLC